MSTERTPVVVKPDEKIINTAKPSTNNPPSTQNHEQASVANVGTITFAQSNTTVAQQEVNKAPTETRQERRARLAQVLDRGVVQDHLHVDLPPHLVGQWVRNDPMEIHRMQLLGFEINTDYVPRTQLNNDGTGRVIVGDVVHMITSRENKEDIDFVMDRHAQRISGLTKDARNEQKEEKDFSKLTRKDTDGVVPVFNEGTARQANRDELANALGLKEP